MIDTRPHPSKVKVLINLLPYLWPKDAPKTRRRVLLAITCLLLSKLASISVPILYKKIVDIFSLKHPALEVPLFLILGYGLVRLLGVLFNELKDALFAYVGQEAIRSLSLQVFKHLFTLSLSYHLSRATGALSRAIERGTSGMDYLLFASFFHTIPIILEITGVCLLLLILYPWYISFLVFLTMACYVLITILLMEWRLRYIRLANTYDDQAGSRSIDSLLNYETVKYFGNEELEAERFDHIREQLARTNVKSKLVLAVLNISQGSTIVLGVVVIMILVSWNVVQQKMTVGDFVLIITYLLQLYMPLGWLGTVYQGIKQALINMEEMLRLLSHKVEITDHPAAKPLKVKEGEIVFDHVAFAYHPNRPILQDISFNVPPGETVAIVGPSGAGKSTLSRLLFRFYEPTGGTIKIDGQSISMVTQKSLRRAIGIVPQDTVLFNDTVFYNIAYGNKDLTLQEVKKAAKLAQLDHFIESLPEKYDTIVGERGLKLSGGEKQRVAIARTILKNPAIYLFDEATSALDTATELEILKSLTRISKGKTTLIITHRLTMAAHADKILVLDKGYIVEEGTHQQLLKKKGLYAELWEKQQEEIRS